MKGRGTGRLILFFIAFLFAGAVLAGDDRQAKEEELAKLRDRIAALRTDLDQVRSHFDGLRDGLRKSERRIGRLARTLRELDKQREQKQKKLRELKARQARLETSVGEQRGHLAKQVRAAYATGHQEYAKILLNQEDPAAVGRVLAYYDYLNRARSERIGALLDTLQELERVGEEIRTETRRLETLRGRRQQEKRELETSLKEREQALAQLKSEIHGKDQRLERLLGDEQELASLVEAITEALEDIPAEPGDRRPFSALKGRLAWPAKGRLVARFGNERPLGDMRWQGVLIEARQGEKVRAVSHGRVAFADWLRGYGLLLIIDHGDGYMSLYGHNHSLYKETGDWVEAGEEIASVGNSGGQTRSALYFEIRHAGRPTDPARWCNKAAG